MLAEFRDALTAARNERSYRSGPEHRGSSIRRAQLRYCCRCKTVRTVDAVVSRVMVRTVNGEPAEISTWTCSCRSCGTLVLLSSAGDKQVFTSPARVAGRGRTVSKSVVQRGRS